MQDLTEGRIVHFVMPLGEHRPAIVTKVWDHTGETGCANLSVFTDYANDAIYTEGEKQVYKNAGIDKEAVAHGHFWATSRLYSEEPKPGTWHWIEKA
jgi:hypothetical protein